MKMTYRARWSDNDHYFGPFTYARDSRGYRPLAAILSSADDDDRGCNLRLSGFGHTLIIALPQIIKPAKSWVDTSHYEWSSGRGGYWQIDKREYGFSYNDGYVSVSHGRSTMDSSTEQRWGWFLPWMQWRHVRRSFYDTAGEHFADEPKRRQAKLGADNWREYHDALSAIENACPTAAFDFKDFDGETLVATARIEEREWRLGEGWFKWLSLFRKPKIRRSLDLRFSGETGKRKGSWKGGTIGTGIDMLPGELHEEAFRRYCEQNGMTFVAAHLRKELKP
jgi:hypothetical protein